MAITYRNTDGAVCIADGGCPRIITVKARNNISGGYWVNGSSANGAVGSNASTYAASDIEGYTVATQIGSQIIGLALTDIASGTYGPVAMRGLFLLPAASGTAVGSIFAGMTICGGSAGTVLPVYSGLALPVPGAAAVFHDFTVGRALTNGGDSTSAAEAGLFVVVSLNL